MKNRSYPYTLSEKQVFSDNTNGRLSHHHQRDHQLYFKSNQLQKNFEVFICECDTHL